MLGNGKAVRARGFNVDSQANQGNPIKPIVENHMEKNMENEMDTGNMG